MPVPKKVYFSVNDKEMGMVGGGGDGGDLDLVGPSPKHALVKGSRT